MGGSVTLKIHCKETIVAGQERSRHQAMSTWRSPEIAENLSGGLCSAVRAKVKGGLGRFSVI